MNKGLSTPFNCAMREYCWILPLHQLFLYKILAFVRCAHAESEVQYSLILYYKHTSMLIHKLTWVFSRLLRLRMCKMLLLWLHVCLFWHCHKVNKCFIVHLSKSWDCVVYLHHDALCSSWNVPWVPRRHSHCHRQQPNTTWSELCRLHGVLRCHMSMDERRACILLLRPTRTERSVFNISWHCQPHPFQKTTQNTPVWFKTLA